jgi:hypothetical protein
MEVTFQLLKRFMHRLMPPETAAGISIHGNLATALAKRTLTI